MDVFPACFAAFTHELRWPTLLLLAEVLTSVAEHSPSHGHFPSSHLLYATGKLPPAPSNVIDDPTTA